MLDLFGREYIIDHCVSVLNEDKKEEFYRIYITETLRLIAKGNGYEIKLGYSDYMKQLTTPDRQTESPEEIIKRIKLKTGAIK